MIHTRFPAALPFDDGIASGLKIYLKRVGIILFLTVLNGVCLSLFWSALVYPLQTALWLVAAILVVVVYLLYQTHIRHRLWVQQRLKGAGITDTIPKAMHLRTLFFGPGLRDSEIVIVKKVTIREIAEKLDHHGAPVKLESDSDGNPILKARSKGAGVV